MLLLSFLLGLDASAADLSGPVVVVAPPPQGLGDKVGEGVVLSKAVQLPVPLEPRVSLNLNSGLRLVAAWGARRVSFTRYAAFTDQQERTRTRQIEGADAAALELRSRLGLTDAHAFDLGEGGPDMLMGRYAGLTYIQLGTSF